MIATTTTHRAVTPDTLLATLQDEATRRVDVTATPAAVRAQDGNILLARTGAVELTETGVTPVPGVFRPTATALTTLATRLDVPGAYLTRTHALLPELFDHTVNGWLDWQARVSGNKPLLFRCLGNPEGDGNGVLRAVLSGRYGIIDNYDILLAVLDGLRHSGMQAHVDSADLGERSMHVRIHVPGIAQAAPALLAGYDSPFRGDGGATRLRIENGRQLAAREGMGYEPGQEPVVFAGLVLRNSETGSGAYTLIPQVVVQVCKNGLSFPLDGMRRTHLGREAGVGVRSSRETDRRVLSLVASQTSDLVADLMTPAWLAGKVEEMSRDAQTPVALPERTVDVVSRKLGFTEAQQKDILSHYLLGGQLTAGGIMQAVSSVAQVTADPDTAYDLERLAPLALIEAARANG